MVDGDEAAEAAARRECEEEIGCAPSELQPVMTFQPSASVLSQTVRLFYGRVDSRKAAFKGGAPGEHEDINVLVLPSPRVAERLAAGAFSSGTTRVGLQWLAMNRDRLRAEA